MGHFLGMLGYCFRNYIRLGTGGESRKADEDNAKMEGVLPMHQLAKVLVPSNQQSGAFVGSLQYNSIRDAGL